MFMKVRVGARGLVAALSVVSMFALVATDDAYAQKSSPTTEATTQAASQRWYDSAQVTRGAGLFARYCSSCHGKNGEGAAGWQGTALPPPLDGTGHTWHHPFAALGYQIKSGGAQVGGKMPGFASTLQDKDILDIIAWFQSRWPDAIYSRWLKVETKARQSSQ